MLLVGSGLLGLMTRPIGPLESAEALGSLVGRAAPTLQAEDLSGRSWTVSDARGRFVWINYWATWCPPCRIEMPMMQRLHERYGDRLLIIGVNFGEDEATVADFVERYEISYPILLDPELENFYRWSAVFGLPMHFFVGPNGRVVRAFTGELPPEAMLETVEALLEESVPLGVTQAPAGRVGAGPPRSLGGTTLASHHEQVAQSQGHRERDRTHPFHGERGYVIAVAIVNEPTQPQISGRSEPGGGQRPAAIALEQRRRQSGAGGSVAKRVPVRLDLDVGAAALNPSGGGW
jgi:thiol-disulfide isomerase/thioredoxin